MKYVMFSLIIFCFTAGCASIQSRPEIVACRTSCDEFCCNCKKMVVECKGPNMACDCFDCDDGAVKKGFVKWNEEPKNVKKQKNKAKRKSKKVAH